MTLERFQQFYRFRFGRRVARRDARYENRKHDFAPVELARCENAVGEGEDVRDAGVGVGEESGLVGGGDQALAGEHGGAGVEG